MKKRIFSILLAVIMVFSVMPMQVQAGGQETDWGNLRVALADETPGTGQDAIEIDDDTTPGVRTVKLLKDIKAVSGSETLSVTTDKPIILDLNGYSISGKIDDENSVGSVIKILDGATLTLIDNSENKTGKITGGKADKGGGIYVSSNNATFIMSGGNITGNTAITSGGGVFVNSNGEFIMSGGKISENTSVNVGGGVRVESAGNFTMSGNSNITDNHAKFSGGGVSFTGDKFNMSGGSVNNNNTESNGGGVTFSGTSFNMTGGSIDHNTANQYGGVQMTKGTLEMSGGNIEFNTATSNFGGLFVNGSVKLGGTAKINGNVTGGVITDGVLSGGISSNLTVNNTTFLIGSGTSAPADGMLVGVTTYNSPTDESPIALTSNGELNDIEYFVSDNADYEVKFNNNHLELAMKSTPSHNHNFTYTANGGKITATCTAGCDEDYDLKPLTLTLTAPSSFVFDRNGKDFTFEDDEEAAWRAAGLELPTITYVAKSGSKLRQGHAVDVGSYTASVTVDTDKTATSDFEITKATPYIKTKPAPTDINCGDKLSASTLAGGYVQISSKYSTQVGGLFEWDAPDTTPAITDSDVTLYNVTFTPSDTNFNTVSCQVTITVNKSHTHNLVKVDGQAATETASGWKDYYECKDSTDACHKYFEDASGNSPITNLDAWKAVDGNGYVAKLTPGPNPTYTLIFNVDDTTKGSVDLVKYEGVEKDTAYKVNGNILYVGETKIPAMAKSGYEFDCWKIGETIVTTGGTIEADTTFTATFKAKAPGSTYAVNITNDDHGTAKAKVDDSTVLEAEPGTEITLEAIPSAGYKFKEWHVLSPLGLEIANNTFTMPNDGVMIEVLFEADEPDKYIILVNTDGNGKAAANKSEALGKEEVTLFAAPIDGYSFDYWETSPRVEITDNKFRMPESSILVMAHFKEDAPKPVEVYYAPLVADLKANEEGVIEWKAGDSLPLEVVKLLVDKPELSLEFTFTYEGEEHTIFIPAGAFEKYYDVTIPWYGPAWLIQYFEKSEKEVIEYTIVKDDTLNALAEKFKCTVEEILALNPYIKNRNKIYPNNKLLIPKK